MSTPIADALVLVLPSAVSLREWEATGVLGREMALYERLRPLYHSIVIVSHGGSSEVQAAASVAPWAAVVCNSEIERPQQYEESLPGRVVTALASAREIVVKTTTLTDGSMAVRILDALRSAEVPGRRVGLLASGGRLSSRFTALEHGPNSLAACEAARHERELGRWADVVAGTTRDMLEDLAWRYELDPAAMMLVPNYVFGGGREGASRGLRSSEELAGAVAGSGSGDEPERQPGLVLSAGRFTRRKRFDTLIRAIAGLPDSLREGVTLRLIGDGPEAPQLFMLAEELGVVCDFVPPLGHSEMLAQMSMCCVYAQASELEGHPRAVLGAMSTGAAVVVADTPGLGDAIQSGVTGLRVVGDAASFTHAIGALLADDDWRVILGAAASRMVRASYSLDVVVKQEIEAHRLTLARAALAGRVRKSSVLWDRSLLSNGTESAAAEWERSLKEFESLLSREEAARFRRRLSRSARLRDTDAA